MDENAHQQSPIFSKTNSFLLWILDHTEKFPKNERFRLAKRLEDTAFEFYELLIKAVRTPSHRQRILIQADLELEKLRLYVRLAQARKLTSKQQYRFAAGELVEIGKLLGGWMKTLKKA